MVDNSKIAILLEDLWAQFQVFGEGLHAVRQDVSGLKQDVSDLKQEFAQERRLNRQEHKLIMQMIQELNHDFQMKRVK